jgi:hypothetical protein
MHLSNCRLRVRSVNHLVSPRRLLDTDQRQHTRGTDRKLGCNLSFGINEHTGWSAASSELPRNCERSIEQNR